MKEPLVSIIIPAYNRATIIVKTIESIIAQTYKNWECIIVDDGSTDATFTELIKFQQKAARIKPFKRPKIRTKGGNACRNYGLEKSIGDYIVWFDSDDIMHNNYLDFQVKALNNTQYNYSICKSTWQTLTGITRQGFRSLRIVSDDPINDYIQFVTFWHINAVCYKRSFIKNNDLLFDETLQQSQEYDFHVKVLRADQNYNVLNHALITIIATEDSISYSEKNTLAKVISSLKVKMRFLKSNKAMGLSLKTIKFLLSDIHNVFQQQTLKKNISASLYAAGVYLLAHFTNKTIFLKYFFKHLIPVIIVSVSYNVLNTGYSLFKKSNTFN